MTMGDRYFLTIKCPRCGLIDTDCYFAPTCDFTTWKCPNCKKSVNLIKYTGITAEMASNAGEIKAMIGGIKDDK